MFKKIVVFSCFLAQLCVGEDLKTAELQIFKNIETYRIRLDNLSQTIKNMSAAQKLVISPKLLEFDDLLKDADRIKRLKKDDFSSAQLSKLDVKLKNRIRFISRYCKDCQAGKMTRSPGERNVFEARLASESQKLEEDQIQYVPTVETVQYESDHDIVNEESGRP